MAVLKKLKASTLMETMVATVLIVVIFMMASLIMNSIFINSRQGDDQRIKAYLQKLEYRYKNGDIITPHFEELDAWNIELDTEDMDNSLYLTLSATHQKTKKQVKRRSAIEE